MEIKVSMHRKADNGDRVAKFIALFSQSKSVVIRHCSYLIIPLWSATYSVTVKEMMVLQQCKSFCIDNAKFFGRSFHSRMFF